MKAPLLLDVRCLAVSDGPGIRTAFFVKGCPLRCLWCHNPESQSPEPQIARFQHLCRHCVKCEMSEATCPTRAFKIYGKSMSISEIVAEALEDKAFYDESGGGVTLSGGEPLLYWEWALELFKAFKAAGLHTCLDTSLFAAPEVIDAILPVTDVWLPDFKAADDDLHRRCTGVANAPIKANLKRLVDLAYHDMARSKYLALGMPVGEAPALWERPLRSSMQSRIHLSAPSDHGMQLNSPTRMGASGVGWQ